MDINNNTNISSQIVNSISKLNLNSSKHISKPSVEKSNELENDFLENDVKKVEKTTKIEQKNKIDVDDIQKYANLMGENLSIDDINYALMYGRSVIADYSV